MPGVKLTAQHQADLRLGRKLRRARNVVKKWPSMVSKLTRQELLEGTEKKRYERAIAFLVARALTK